MRSSRLRSSSRPGPPGRSAAQPQCASCHQSGTEGAPLCDGKRQWHKDHAFASFCTDCHGGDPEATDIGRAHAGLVWPLAGEGARCESCHPGRGNSLAKPYLAARTAAPAPQRRRNAGDAILAAVALLLAAGGSAYVIHNERRR